MSHRARWLTRLLGPAILAYFLLTTDLHRIAAILRDVRWTPLLLSLALFPGVVLTKAWRWRRLIAELGVPAPSLGRSVTLFLIGQFAGAATPGQSGDFVRAWYLRERGSALSTALFSVLFDRLLDFLLLALVSLVGLVAFLDVFPPRCGRRSSARRVGFAAVIVVVVPALMARRSRRWLIGRRAPLRTAVDAAATRALAGVARQPPGPSASRAGAALRDGRGDGGGDGADLAALPRARRRRAVGAAGGAAALISILQTLPVSVAGVGVRDAVLVAVLAHHGYPAERALALSALFLVLVIEQMLIGFFVAMRHPLGDAAREPLAMPRGDAGAP